MQSREFEPGINLVFITTLSILCAGVAITSPDLFKGGWKNVIQKVFSPSTIASNVAFNINSKDLFATADPKKSLGVRAICAAEGNCDSEGNRTALSRGHRDPGNGKWNRGWCSDQGRGKNEAEADIKCLQYVRKWLEGNSDARQLGDEVFINALDLANQSSIKKGLANKYKQALKEGKHGIEAITHARIEAFRRENGELSASGLFRVCSNPRNLFYKRLRGLTPGSEQWRYNCIRQDQKRRVEAINKVLTRSK